MANLSRSFNFPRFLTRSKFALIAFLAILFVGSFAQADETQRWIPGVSGSTTDASVWENGTALPSGATGYVYDGVQSINNTTLDGNRTLEFTGGTTSFPNKLTMTSGGFTVKGGTLNTYYLYADGGASLDISGGVWNMGAERLSINGSSVMTISGDSVINFNGCYFLDGRDTKGSVIQSGNSILNLNTVWFSDKSGGCFNVGEYANAAGSTYDLQGGTINVKSGEFRVTYGTFTQSDGVLNVSNGSGIELKNSTSVVNLTGGTLNLTGTGYINAAKGAFNVTGGSINVTPTASDVTAGKKIIGIFRDEATAQQVLAKTTMADGWTAGVVTVNNQTMILAGQDTVPTGLKIWKGEEGDMSDETNWNGTTSDTTGYVFSGTNTFTDFSGNLIINGGTNTINSSSDPENIPLITSGQTLVYNGGTNTLGSGYVTSQGIIYVNGGKVSSAGNSNLRIYGTVSDMAYLEVNGTLTVSRWLAIAKVASTNCTGKAVINSGIVYCGNSKGGGLAVGDGNGANGELVLNGGTLQINNSQGSNFATSDNATAKFTMTGGTYTTGGTISIGTGKKAKATVDISGGELNSTGTINIGTGSGAKGYVTISGGEVTALRVKVGRKSAGDDAKLTITGGKLIVTQDICGSDSSASGCIYITDTGQLVLNSTYTSSAGIRELTKFHIAGVGDGTGALRFLKSLECKSQITLTDNATIGIEPGATFTQSAAIVQTKASVLTIKGGGTLALSTASSFTGGTTIDSSIVQLSGTGTLGTGAITLNDGTLILNGVTSSIASNISGTGDITVSSGTATLTGAVTQTGGNTTLANGTSLSLGADSTLNNLGSANESSKGTLTTGNVTLNNDTTTKFIGSITADSINKTGNGTLQLCALNDEGETIDAESFVVTSGRLDMKDYFKGSLEIQDSAVLSPGNSIGTLTVDGTELASNIDALILDSGSTLLMEIGSTSAEGNDQLIVNGNLSIENGAIIQFDLDTTSGYFPTNGEFIYVNMPDVNWENVTFSSYYFTRQGYDGTNLILGVNPNAVPEPSTWALLILGAAGLMCWRKRK